jgi:phosphoglycerol transferase
MMRLLAGLVLALIIPLAGAIMTDAPAIWPVSTLLYNLGLLCLFALVPRKPVSLVLFNVVAGLFFVVEAAFFFSFYLQNAGFNEAFFYHLRPDLFYAGVTEHTPIMLLALGGLFGFLFMSSSGLNKLAIAKGWMLFAAGGLLAFGLFISPPAKALVHYAGNFSAAGPDHQHFEDFPELRNPKLAIEFTQSKRPNLVLIYAESLEQRFFDESIFPGLLPNLQRLKRESIDFTNVAQGVGAGWTVGGIVASQCGYPLAGSHGVTDNNLSMFDEFLPRATCIGDLLEKDGYHLAFLGGADPRFAGKGDFLRAHGYTEVYGRDELEATLADKTYLNPWGVFDDTLFDYAIEKFIDLNRTKSPFMLTLLTIDTHHPNGFLSKSCGIYAQGDNSMLNSVHCSDLLLARFIEQIRTSPYSDDTVIIVVSDHLALRNTATPLLKASQMPERLTFFVSTPEGMKGADSAPGLHYDIAPTILDLIGYRIDGRMGFGASLARGPGYLPGRFGLDDWKMRSATLMAIGSGLWNNATALDAEGISFRVSDLTLTMGGRIFKLRAGGFLEVPASTLMLFDPETLELKQIKAYPLEQDLSRETLAEELLQSPDQLALVISQAKNLPGFSAPKTHPERWVYFCGKPGSDFFSWGPITGDFRIPFALIKELSNGNLDERTVRDRQRLIQALPGERNIGSGRERG